MHTQWYAYALSLWGLVPAVGSAAEISVLSAGAVRAPVSSLVETYRLRTGHKVGIDYSPVGPIRQKIAAGERADAVIVTAEVTEELEKQGKIVPGSGVALGEVGVGVAVREGAPLPDISTPEALRRTLLAAKSLVYVDPTKGTSGKHFAGVLQRLGIADAVKPRTLLLDGGNVVEAVAKGEVEIGVQQVSEILPVKGVRLVGPLPLELQKITTYVGAVMIGAKSPEVAAAFLRHLAGEEGRAMFASRGFGPPR